MKKISFVKRSFNPKERRNTSFNKSIQFVNAGKQKSHCIMILVEISPPADLCNSIFFVALLTSTNVTRRKKNLVIFLNLLLIIFRLGWFWNFITML